MEIPLARNSLRSKSPGPTELAIHERELGQFIGLMGTSVRTLDQLTDRFALALVPTRLSGAVGGPTCSTRIIS